MTSSIESVWENPRVTVLAKVPSGEIRIERGADGAYLLFDADCLDALPYCKAQCCALRGTIVSEEEVERANLQAEWDHRTQELVIRRDSDGYCTHLDRKNTTCSVYENRPNVCRAFHCTRGSDVRGFKLSNQVHRQSMS